eukprot:CAMPEP_0170615886 /NCGR_PEP_ID=MMETSP0224-20130122/25579_1 /TAXON_ID=285029 /ORGANISM="Togula jolla, Strain CCCM 725" /LENGTH=66 /DNA_ID=CAMNT_0010941653 /DNA_START=256 /DNA_END=456 /DNA_ORIENTATION=-
MQMHQDSALYSSDHGPWPVAEEKPPGSAFTQTWWAPASLPRKVHWPFSPEPALELELLLQSCSGAP